MPRKQSIKRKKSASVHANNEEKKAKSNCFQVPDTYVDSQNWNELYNNIDLDNKTVAQNNYVLEVNQFIDDSAEESCLNDVKDLEDDDNVSRKNKTIPECDLSPCSMEIVRCEDEGDDENEVKLSQNLSSLVVTTDQIHPVNYSDDSNTKKSSFTLSNNENVAVKDLSQSRTPHSDTVKSLTHFETSTNLKNGSESFKSVEQPFVQSKSFLQKTAKYFGHSEKEREKMSDSTEESEDEFENKPYDLSLKSESKNGLDLTVSHPQKQPDISKADNVSESDCDDKMDESDEQKDSQEEVGNIQNNDIMQQQQMLLAHLSKFQQNFVSNLIQYQARFIAHYQQLQQQMMSEASSGSEDEAGPQEDEDKNEETEVDKEEGSDSEETNKTSSVMPPLIPAAHVLNNLVPYAIYQSLLPNASEGPLPLTSLNNNNSSSSSPLVSSLASLSSQQAPEDIEENGEHSEADDSDLLTPADVSSSLLQHLVRKSSEIAQINSSDSSSIQKYSILNSLIGSSKFSSSSTATKIADNDDNDIGNASFQFKRKRIAFSAKQYELLQTTFEHNNFPEPGDQQCIARQLKAPYRSIKMWFQNKRANARKKLFPGEKGSGRTTTGEKIPGDTDTRFYCDKCPSAFICQKYLTNHLDAHQLYTKGCPKCHVVFTHECLLNTHTISKCGSKEEKLATKKDGWSQREKSLGKENKTVEGQSDIATEGDQEEPKSESQKMNGYHDDLNGVEEDKAGISSSILAQLNSPLPLLTLLQIQKTQEEQKKNEVKSDDERQIEEDGDTRTSVASGDLCSSSGALQNGTTLDRNNSPQQTDAGGTQSHHTDKGGTVPKKKIPPLIPSALVKPLVNNAARFAILRQLLTNYHEQKEVNNTSLDNQEEESQLSSYPTADDNEPEDMKGAQPEFKPKNIPEHLYQLLDNKNGIHRYASYDEASVVSDNLSGNEEGPNEAEPLDEEAIMMVRNNKEGTESSDEKRKLNSYFDEKDAKLKGQLNRGPKPKRLRRRTTVFTESQHRVLYLHFTHCNFPDPSMFRILSKLTGLTPHVIKIWFQNERSRQRRQVSNSEGEVPREKKPYKCRDCGVEFAMPAFLVKHCMRHIPTDNVTSQARKCPICMVEFETQKLHSHFMASHNLSIMLEDESNNEENICHLCKEHFSDLNSLSIHKNEHLKDTTYGDPPQCVDCKTTFVNVLCLEAHMATHYKFKWDHSCLKCKMKFYDKILLESHILSHSMSNNSKHLSPPATATDETQPNNNQQQQQQQQSQYLISLLQQISDSKNIPIKPKLEDPDNSAALDVMDNEEKMIVTSLSQNGESVHTSTTQGRPLANLSFKFIPVKFVPVTTSTDQTAQTPSNEAMPVVTVISPTFLTPQENNKAPHTTNHDLVDSTTTSFKVENFDDGGNDRVVELNISDCYTGKKMKKVPNLIPISESGISINEVVPSDHSVTVEVISDSNTEKGSSSENDLKENDESSSLVQFSSSVENLDSQVLVYTPYASEYRKRRRTPTHFNSSQRDILEAYYKYDNFPDPSEQLHLSEYLRVPYSVIKTWFQNTRKNHRKHLKESLNFDVGGPFECMDCRVCFVSKIYLESHVRQHSESQPFLCQLCRQQFPHHAVYDIHKKMGCSKKCKKKHDQIRQFSSMTRTFKLSDKEEMTVETKDSEKLSSYSELPPYPDLPPYSERPRRKRKLSKNSDESNVKYFKFEYVEEEPPMVSKNDSQQRNLTTSESTEKSGENSLSLQQNVDNEKTSGVRCGSCNTIVDHPAQLSDHRCPGFTPQLLGYTCPECNKTFQSFVDIAEHKEKSNCRKLHHILPAPRIKFYKAKYANSSHFTMSELFNLYPGASPSTNSTTDYKKQERKTVVNNSVKDKFGFSRSSICFLQVHYKHDNYPSTKDIELMSKRLGIEWEKVDMWFQKQRSRERRGRSLGYKPPHQCRDCPSVFVHADGLREHEKSVHNPWRISIEFMCPLDNCKAKFPNATLLQTHQLEHTGEEETKQDVLSPLQSSEVPSSTAETHDDVLKIHTPFLEAFFRENNFPPKSEIAFIAQRLKVETTAVQHWYKLRTSGKVSSLHTSEKRQIHNLSPLDIYCPASGRRVSSDVAESEDPASKAGNNECTICYASFQQPQMLVQHQKIHSTNFSLVCWECGADFCSPLALETHMSRHGYSIPYDVMSASKSLVVNSSLDIKYSFVQLQVLYNHFRISNYPKKEEIKLISRRLKVPMKHVQTWFKHQRIAELNLSKNLCKDSCSTSNESTKPVLNCKPRKEISRSTGSVGSSETDREGDASEDESGKVLTFDIGSSKNSVDSGSSKTGLDSGVLSCEICPSEFVSKRLLTRHKAIHESACAFSCASCTAFFLHQMVMDTHTLKHYLGGVTSSSPGASNASSELGLKARSKVLDRETKARLRKLIDDGKDVDLFFASPVGGTRYQGNENKEVARNAEMPMTTLREMLLSKKTSPSTPTPPSTSTLFGFQGNEMDAADGDLDDEDDDEKLVIDE